MRDAFGGAFSIKLMLIFLILYVSFICVAINYARAFRVKNEIINMIEQNEGYSEALDTRISSYLSSTGYFVEYNNASTCSQSEYKQPGYCIKTVNTNPTYYRVETYMLFRLPIINIDFPIRVQGETRRIETF